MCYSPFLQIATYPHAISLVEMAISPKRQNEGYTCFLPWLLSGLVRGKFTPHSEAKSEGFDKEAAEHHSS